MYYKGVKLTTDDSDGQKPTLSYQPRTGSRKMAQEIEVDERRRVSLGKVIGEDVRRLRVEEMADGSLLLTPVVSLSARELSVLADPDRVARIQAGIIEAKEGKIVRHGPGYWAERAKALGAEEDD